MYFLGGKNYIKLLNIEYVGKYVKKLSSVIYTEYKLAAQ
jgi:hypothetical protein